MFCGWLSSSVSRLADTGFLRSSLSFAAFAHVARVPAGRSTTCGKDLLALIPTYEQHPDRFKKKNKKNNQVVLAELQIGRFVKCTLRPRLLPKLVKWFFMQHRHVFHDSFRIFGDLATSTSLNFEFFSWWSFSSVSSSFSSSFSPESFQELLAVLSSACPERDCHYHPADAVLD